MRLTIHKIVLMPCKVRIAEDTHICILHRHSQSLRSLYHAQYVAQVNYGHIMIEKQCLVWKFNCNHHYLFLASAKI